MNKRRNRLCANSTKCLVSTFNSWEQDNRNQLHSQPAKSDQKCYANAGKKSRDYCLPLWYTKFSRKKNFNTTRVPPISILSLTGGTDSCYSWLVFYIKFANCRIYCKWTSTLSERWFGIGVNAMCVEGTRKVSRMRLGGNSNLFMRKISRACCFNFWLSFSKIHLKKTNNLTYFTSRYNGKIFQIAQESALWHLA